MLTSHFYHEIIRKIIISFGTLFNGIEIKHQDKNDNTFSVFNVPISYGPTQKFLARLEQSRDLRSPGKPAGAITLPRMSFEMIGVEYDSSRKISTMQTFKAVNKDTNKLIKGYMPVPYNINMQLSILTKLNEDALQILEQILPYFQPSFNLTVNLTNTIGETRDIPIVLEAIQMDDNYEGDFLTRRALIYTLNFTCKAYLYGPINATTDGLIKKVQVDYMQGTDNLKTPDRQLRYTAVPIAIKDYDNDDTARTGEVFDDQVTAFTVSDATPFVSNSYIQIDEEVMRIKSKSGQRLHVERGEYGTVAVPHDIDVQINAITIQDDAYVEANLDEDDFGFGETRTEYRDGQVYSISQSRDSDL
tara:strand:- start:968 stop:2047 length:1080 start_codon:yes stop_codon:yes gene_type:complete